MKQKFIRYTLGFVILGTIIASIAFSVKALFLVSVLFIIFTLKEYREMFLAKNIYVHKYLPEIISIFCAYICIKNIHQFIMPCLVIGVFFSFAITVIKNKKPYLYTTFSTIMGFMLAFCALYIIKLFYFYQTNQIPFIITYFFAVMAGDFSASRIGPHFKNRLLSPEISPNKTVAGAIANLCFTFIVSLFLIPVLKFNIFEVLLFSVSVSLCAQIGDLSISTIKRDLGIKHSGNLFLNYGGILDRVDAFIFSAPAAFYAVNLIQLLQEFHALR